MNNETIENRNTLGIYTSTNLSNEMQILVAQRTLHSKLVQYLLLAKFGKIQVKVPNRTSSNLHKETHSCPDFLVSVSLALMLLARYILFSCLILAFYDDKFQTHTDRKGALPHGIIDR